MRALVARLKSLFFSQRPKTYCSVCKNDGLGFAPLPPVYRENAEKHSYRYFGQGEMTPLDTYLCNGCASSDRERLYAYWLDREVAAGRLTKQMKMIHFAPEQALSDYIRKQKYFNDYQTADLSMTGVDHQVDLMELPFADNSVDFFICSHVLEHVPDDRRAMRELFRITGKRGRGVMMAPIVVGLEKTVEDPSCDDEAERWRLFGQNDHVRLYSHNDYVSRVKESGFVLEQLTMKDFGSEIFSRLGLKPTSIIYIVTKE